MRGMRRAFTAATVLLSLVLVLSACSSSHAKAPASTSSAPSQSSSSQSAVQSSPAPMTGPPVSGSFRPPQQKLFAPYDDNGTLVANAPNKTTGSCFSSSITIPIAGVFRCLSGNTIWDPCFAPAVETNPLTVACFVDPWTPGTIMSLTKALPTENLILKNGDPWALELSDSTHCVVLTGALPELGDNVLDYNCTGDKVASLQTSSDGAISVLEGPAKGPLVPSGISVAWRGQSYRFGSTN